MSEPSACATSLGGPSASALGLDLVFQPTSVFAGTTATLTLVVSVPLTGAAVTIASSDSIVVPFPVTGGKATPLVTTLVGITPTPPSSQWNMIGPQSGKFIIYPGSDVTLQPGDSLNFQFSTLSIVDQVSAPIVTLQLRIGVNSGSAPLTVLVVEALPGIIAWATPPMVALNQLSTLRWTTIGGTTVRVIGYTSSSVPNGYKDFPVGGPAQTAVNPTIDAPAYSGPNPGPSQHPYVVELLSEPGDQIQGTPQTVQVYLHQPTIVQYGFVLKDSTVAPAITINFGDSVTLQWNCKFVDANQGITLAYNSRKMANLPISQMTFNPSQGGLPTNAPTVAVTLNAPGYGLTATASALITFNPIKILYFKFSTWVVENGVDVLSGLTWLTAPAVPQGVTSGPVVGTDNLWFLTVTGPGGPLTLYLGLGTETYLEIRYFSPTAPVKINTPFTLQWFTNAASSLTLSGPGGQTVIPNGQIAKGQSVAFTISAPTTYVLIATAAGQASVVSTLLVTPS